LAQSRRGQKVAVSLHERPVVRSAVLPDGRTVTVRVALLDDSYVSPDEIDTVVVELVYGDEVLGLVETALSADDDGDASTLAERVRDGLERGELQPSADGIEHIALTRPR
jgi:hypothetical protein